ncbi:uncharacterized protein LOC131595152 [Vicia villosa]|uniref:uncharacterized protein LOC131595152 n=1 Tax=Vicia villosa TaxID=3911 RepID=UPI00273A9C51|nr:uncharacterized protein LOC131595152 [Vicia villosa]
MLHHRDFPYLHKLPSTPKCHFLLLKLKPHSFNFFSAAAATTSDSDKKCFTISYLTNNCGLSPQDALKVSKRFTFETPEKPNSVITFFKTQGFSDDQIQSIIRRNPQLIVSSPIKTILLKFQFLASKRASPSDIVATVTRSSRFLRASLHQHIIPAFELVTTFCPLIKKLLLQWDAKIDAFKCWGCSEDEIFNAFKRNPKIMLRSSDKLNAVMSFWIKQLGWDPSALMAALNLFEFSLEKRLIPRALVVQYLLSKGLMKKSASLRTPFGLSDELFMKKYVDCYEDEASRLLRLYQGEDTSIQCSDKL